MIKNKELVYFAFFNTKENTLYYNQLKELTKLSHSSLQRVIKKLKENQEIIEDKKKNNTYYSLTKKYLPIEFSKITIDKVNNLSLNVKITIKEFIKLVPKNIYTCLLFGSASRKKETESSDIDLLLILYNYENKELEKLYNKEIERKIKEVKEKLETTSVHPISIAITNKEKFDKQEDYLIEQATVSGFPIINQINYYNER